MWFIAAGSGPLSLDTLFAAGASRSALPLRRRIETLYAHFSRTLEPLVLLLFRLVLASALLALLANAPAPMAVIGSLAGWQSAEVVSLVPGLVPGLAALLIVGLATRPLAALLSTVTALAMLREPGQTSDSFALSLLAVLLFQGAGRWSIEERLSARWASLLEPSAWDGASLPHVVVVGSGFAGLSVVEGLRDVRCRITLVDRRNYHLFQPLLYQAATCGLSAADIATPIREFVREQRNVRVLLGRVTDVDRVAKEVRIGPTPLGYDILVLATGARHDYFGNDHFEAVAAGLKKIDDATAIRRRLLLAFEPAEQTTDPVERAAELTFVIVGGGPTGVEMAAAVVELGAFKLTGAPASWFWGIVHVFFLAHLRHRIAVSLQWLWAYLTWRMSTRLITGDEA